MNENKEHIKLIPKLRFPEFKGDGEWVEKKLGEFGKIVTGTTPSTKKNEYYENGVYPWVTPTDITENKDIYTTKKLLTEKGLKVGRFIPKNSLLVTCIASIGKNAVLRKNGSCNQQINAIIPNDYYNVDFLYYLIENNTQILLSNAGQGGMAILNKSDFSNISLLLPVQEDEKEQKEQQKIAACLSSLDELIKARKQKLALLKQHKKGLMQNLFPQEGEKVPNLRFPEFKDDGEWVEKKLGELATRVLKKNKNGLIKTVFTNSAVDGIVEQRDFFDKDIANKSNLENYYIVEQEDYIYNPRISKYAPVGPLFKNNTKKTGVMSPLYTIFRFKNKDNNFYQYYFKSNHWFSSIRRVSNTGARFDRMSITSSDFMKIPILSPPVKEQQKIAECLSSLDEIITAEAKKIEQLENHKKGLMQGLFPSGNGEL